MIKQFFIVGTLLLYAEFVLSGLSYMLLAYDVQMFRDVFSVLPLCDWALSVYVLCVAHMFHAAILFGWFFSFQYVVLGLGVVSVMEEVGLRTSLIFGDYHFSSTLGSFLTPNLPVLVPFLWFSLSYPIFLYCYFLIERKGASKKIVFRRTLLASTLLTSYDLISDPIGVLYGNQVWYHAAHVDSVNSLETYVPQPDWAFNRQQATDIDAALPINTSIRQNLIRMLSFPCHYDIPLHNFLGWFVTSALMYSAIFTCALYPTSPKMMLEENDKYFRLGSSAIFSWTPVVAGLICTQFFYLLHPCHPLLVRKQAQADLELLNRVWQYFKDYDG